MHKSINFYIKKMYLIIKKFKINVFEEIFFGLFEFVNLA